MAREFVENAARNFVAALGGLVGVGRGAERDGLVGLDPAQVMAQQRGRMLLDVDLALEVEPVAHLHKFVGIARVAVFAGEFAAAVGIDGPGEGHGAVADAAVQQRFRLEREVLDIVAFADGFAFAGQARNADQPGMGGAGVGEVEARAGVRRGGGEGAGGVRRREQRQGRHIFAFCSPTIFLFAALVKAAGGVVSIEKNSATPPPPAAAEGDTTGSSKNEVIPERGIWLNQRSVRTLPYRSILKITATNTVRVKKL